MDASDKAALESRRRRVLYRATHRGTHEADLLIGGFVSRRITTFTDAELDSLEAFLELPDVDLVDWLTGRRPVPEEADAKLLRSIKDSAG